MKDWNFFLCLVSLSSPLVSSFFLCSGRAWCRSERSAVCTVVGHKKMNDDPVPPTRRRQTTPAGLAVLVVEGALPTKRGSDDSLQTEPRATADDRLHSLWKVSACRPSLAATVQPAGHPATLTFTQPLSYSCGSREHANACACLSERERTDAGDFWKREVIKLVLQQRSSWLSLFVLCNSLAAYFIFSKHAGELVTISQQNRQ